MSKGYNYRVDAACLEVAYQAEPDENPFFKEGRGEVYDVARSFCSNCPVVVDCLLESINEGIGFFGCMSVNERAGLRRDMLLGESFYKSVEKVWEYHRRNGSDRAPDKTIWMEWNA